MAKFDITIYDLFQLLSFYSNKKELCGCVLWGMRWTHVSPAGETLQEVEGSKRCIWPSRCHCHSLSLAPV